MTMARDDLERRSSAARAVYGFEEMALARVETVKRETGAWPGVRRGTSGFWLTYDPADPRPRRDGVA
jgi:hypothetical protein